VHVLEKERDRLQFERDEFEKHLRQLEGANEENRQLIGDKMGMMEQIRKLESAMERVICEKEQSERTVEHLRKERSDQAKEVSELREQILLE